MWSEDEIVILSESGSESGAPAPAGQQADPLVARLADMGFTTDSAQRALQIKTGNFDEALNLLLEKQSAGVMKMQVPISSSTSASPAAFGSGASSSKDVPPLGSSVSGGGKSVFLSADATMTDFQSLLEQALLQENYEEASKIRDEIRKKELGDSSLSVNQLLKKLEEQKEQAVQAQHYELAGQLRDKIQSLKQKMPAIESKHPESKYHPNTRKRERDHSNPFILAKKHKADVLSNHDQTPVVANGVSVATSSKDVPAPPKDAFGVATGGSGNSSSKDVPPILAKNNMVVQGINLHSVGAVNNTDSNKQDSKVKDTVVSAESTAASSTDVIPPPCDANQKKKPLAKIFRRDEVKKTPKQYVELQRSAIAEVSNETRNFPTDADLLEIPLHPSNAMHKTKDMPDAKPNLTCIWNGQGQLRQQPATQTLLDTVIPLDKEVCKKGLEYWWHQGRGPYSNHNGYVGGYKWKSRFEHLSDYDATAKNGGKAPPHVGPALYVQPKTTTDIIPTSFLRCYNRQHVYVSASLSNIEKLKSKVTNFLASVEDGSDFHTSQTTGTTNDAHLFFGAIDERAIGSLGLPIVLMQDPRKFGSVLCQQVPNLFDTWFSISQDTVRKCQTSDERDMTLCLELANNSEETIQGQEVSHWFRDGSVVDQPFLFQKGRQPSKSFCENCGQWVADRKRHLKDCLTNWNCPDHVYHRDRDPYLSLRMFQQTIGLDIGVTVQFRYVDQDNVQVKLCADFESLLRSMLHMDYWPHDSTIARWRILKNQSLAEDHVTTSHRFKKKSSNFTMKNSLDMPQAPSPSCFLHELHEAQSHTLSWMYAREGRSHDGHVDSSCDPSPFKAKQVLSRRIAGSDVKVEVELERSYDRVRGGILGDQVGYGKTACMIALIAQTHLKDPVQATIAEWEKPYAKEYIFTNATLIVTPPNLFDQWSGEFKKFVDKKKCDLKILTICNHTYMKRYKMQDFVEADVVLVSFRFFFSDAYRKYFDREVAVGGCGNKETYHTRRMIKCRHRVFDFLKRNKLGNLLSQKALFEAFYWKRIVFDEFHEVVQIETKISYCFMRQLHSRYHWGLTATPLLSSVDGVQKMASLLHIFLPPNLDEQNAQSFVSEFLRANKWDVETVPLEEKLVKVAHSAEERALYLNQERNMVGQDGINNLRTSASERLLQFCSHFCPDGHAQSVGSAIQNVRKDNTLQQDRLRRQITRANNNVEKQQQKSDIVARFKKFVLRMRSQYDNASDGVAAFVHSTKHQLVELMGDWREGQQVILAKFNKFRTMTQAGRDKDGHRHCNLCVALRSNGSITNDSYQAMLRVAESIPKDIEKQLKDKEAALRFLDNSIKSVTEVQAGEEAPECSLCMEPMVPDDTVITQCGHTYHELCIRDVLVNNAMCPLCRAPTTMQQCTKVKELSLLIENDAPVDPSREELRKKVGSKIMAIVDLIKSIDKKEKILIFIQWDRIRDSLVNAIHSGTGFKPHVLQGDTFQRNKILKFFLEGTEAKDQVMMLSIEQSATGVNLVCANHCILVHPMFGSHKYATDCEKQAIGRIRRQGQQRKCFVYRFYTEGTIEERLMKEHSKELKDAPMALEEDDDQLENSKLNKYHEPNVPARPLNAHMAVSGLPRCTSCDEHLDFCKVGSAELARLNVDRHRLHGDIAERWTCDECKKDFHSETTSRYACIEKPECDYDVCEACYMKLKGGDFDEFPGVASIKAIYAYCNDATFAIGHDSNNKLVFQKAGAKKVTKLVKTVTEFRQVKYQRPHDWRLNAQFSLELQPDVADRLETGIHPPYTLGWTYRYSHGMFGYVGSDNERWTLLTPDKQNVPDPRLCPPFNIPDPALKKARERQ